MKKFFELAVVSRKSVKGDVICRLEAESKREENLGYAEVVIQDEAINGGLYFRYVANREADEKVPISSIEIKTKNPEKVTNVLREIKEGVLEKVMKEYQGDVLSQFMGIAIVTRIFDVERGKIEFPEELEIFLTNEMISEYVNDEWLGIELKLDETVAKKLHEFVKNSKEKVLEETDF